MTAAGKNRSEVDIAIVGGGWTGASLACALSESRYRVALIEPLAAVSDDTPWDARIYAVSPGSERFLRNTGVWDRLDPHRIQAVNEMRVFGDAPGAELVFSAYQAAVDRLATIVEARALQEALWSRLTEIRGLQIFRPARASTLDWHAEGCEIHLEDGRTVAARLVVGADGMRSVVRTAARLDARIDPAQQIAVVANFSTEHEHHGTAFQWFRDDGVLAWLPLPGRRISIVWSARSERAEELLRLDGAALCERVAKAGGDRLGKLNVLAPAQGFPLAWMTVAPRVAPRVALIGDAAHVVHPLAGQGVNLGLGDARELVAMLAAGAERDEDPGRLSVLRQFERSRAEVILAMQLATRGLKHLFGAESRGIVWLRNAGLNLTDRAEVLKQWLARRAME